MKSNGRENKSFFGYFWSFIKSVLITILVLILLAVLTAIAINIRVITTTQDHIYDSSSKNEIVLEDASPYEYIVVLGTSVRGNEPSDVLKDRLDEAIELFHAGFAPEMLMTGDQQEYYDEVGVMRNYAIEHGVPEDAIVTDPYGYSTYESMTNLLETYNVEKAIIVTQAYHVPRSVYVARTIGIDAIGVNANDLNARTSSMFNIREIIARTKDFIFAHLRPEHTLSFYPALQRILGDL